MKYKLSKSFLKRWKKLIIKETKNSNVFDQGYVLHYYLPPVVFEKVFAEYIKQKIFAVISLPSKHGSYPSIWSSSPRFYNRKVVAIWKKFSDEIEIESRRIERCRDEK